MTRLTKRIRKSPPVTRVRRLLAYLLALAVGVLVRRLSHERVVSLGRRLGRLAFRLARSERRRAEANLRRAFGDEKTPDEILRIAREVFENFAVTALEFPRLRGQSDEEFFGRIEYEKEQIDYLRRVFSEGRGAIYASAHLANWEMLAEFGARLGLNMSVLYKPSTNPYFNRLWREWRKSNRLIDISRNLSAVIRRLKRNEAVCLLFDENARSRGVPVEFFGSPASTYSGPAYFSVRASAPILCLYFVRTAGWKMKFVIERTIRPERGADIRVEIPRIMREMNSSLEKMLRLHPGQWYWFYRRW